MEKLRYIHQNPVKRGLVLEPDQWAWSSFRYYAYDERGPVLVNAFASPFCGVLSRSFDPIFLPPVRSKLSTLQLALSIWSLSSGESPQT
jgi:hypothetical protein